MDRPQRDGQHANTTARRKCHAPADLRRRGPHFLGAQLLVKLQKTGRGAAWLARLLWEQEVESSNLSAPNAISVSRMRRIPWINGVIFRTALGEYRRRREDVNRSGSPTGRRG